MLKIIDSSLPNPLTEPKSKKRKNDSEIIHSTSPYISVEKPDLKIMQINFLMCGNCWEFIYSSDILQRGN